jgi:PhoH-like ATPase
LTHRCFLSDADALFSFGNNDVFIPLKVLEEVDKHKKRQDSVGFHARKIIKHLDGLREKGSLVKGIRPEQGKGIIKVCDHDFEGISKTPLDLASTGSHIILSAALKFKKIGKNVKQLLCLVILT